MANQDQGAQGLLTRGERSCIGAFCILAFLRVAFFLAAFPFFSNIDEGLHVDLVAKYSLGQWPTGIEPFIPKSAHYLSIYNSPEYLNDFGAHPQKAVPPPPWKQLQEPDPNSLPPPVAFWLQYKNFESGQMPLYYAVVGVWMQLGELLGFEDLGLLYWTRLLNAFLAALLVWISYFAARLVFPDQLGCRMAVPLLLAFVPQDAFYQVQNDVFSPLSFGVLFLLLFRGWKLESPTRSWAAATGFLFSATYLVKTSNLPLLFVAGCVLLAQAWQWTQRGIGKRILVPALIFSVCAFVPIAFWTIHLKHAFGDATAASGKMQLLGWQYKPFADWFNHPIFSFKGSWTFSHELLASFWRGEFDWNKHRLASPAADLFFSISSVILITAAFPSLFETHTQNNQHQRRFLWIAALCVAASIGFYFLLSIMFDFGISAYPSKQFPYFASGRLMAGALIPFFILYVRGLNFFFRSSGKNWPTIVSALVIAAVATISEIILTLPVLHSEYNWFHL